MAPTRFPWRVRSRARTVTNSFEQLALAYPRRAEIDRRAQVEQEPGGDLPVLVVLPHVGDRQAGGDVPVDVADIVVNLVFAQVGEVQPEPAEERPVVALQQPVETAEDRPLEPREDLLRIPIRP